MISLIVCMYCAGVAELVDALVLGTSGFGRGGSSPFTRTILLSDLMCNKYLEYALRFENNIRQIKIEII